jgi:hypothetical protein
MDMCNGTKCPLNKRCLRATGDPNRFEGWFMQVPYDHKKRSCEFFMEEELVQPTAAVQGNMHQTIQ